MRSVLLFTETILAKGTAFMIGLGIVVIIAILLGQATPAKVRHPFTSLMDDSHHLYLSIKTIKKVISQDAT